MSNPVVFDLALLALLFFSSVYDLAQRRIPNFLLFSGLMVSAGMHLFTRAPIALLTDWLAGFAVGMCMFLPLYLGRSMAAGDVKLMATVGAFVGPVLAFEASLATYCFGGLFALLLVIAKGRLRDAAHNIGAVLHPWLMRAQGLPAARAAPIASVGGMPYALAITAGTLLTLWLRPA